MNKVMDHVQNGLCNCFACSMQHLREFPDIIERDKLKVALGGLMVAAKGKKSMPADDVLVNRQYLIGLIHGMLSALDSMNVPAFITGDAELIHSSVGHIMQTVAKLTMKEEPELVKNIMADFFAIKAKQKSN